MDLVPHHLPGLTPFSDAMKSPHAFRLALALALLFSLPLGAQTINKNIQKDSSGNLTESLATGNKTVTISSGGNLTAASGATVNLTNSTLALPAQYAIPSLTGQSGKTLSNNGSALTWSSAGAGDVTGPASATDNAIARFDATTGRLLQNSAATISDAGDLSVASATISGTAAAGNVTASGSLKLDTNNSSYLVGKIAAGTEVSLLRVTSGDVLRIIAPSDVGGIQFTNQAQNTTWGTLIGGNLTLTGTGTHVLPGTVQAGAGHDVDAGRYFYVGARTAISGQGGAVRMRDDTGTQRWLLGLLGTAAATDWTLYDIVGNTPRVTISSSDGASHILATTNATNTTSGALRIGSNVGLSGTPGGPAFFGGPLIAGAATTLAPSFRAPHGTAPTSPSDGDLWTTTGGLFARINGSTVGPYGTGNITTTAVDGYFADPSTNASFASAAWRSDLGLVIGTNVQAYNATLAGLAGKSTTGTTNIVLSDSPTLTGTALVGNVTAAGNLKLDTNNTSYLLGKLAGGTEVSLARVTSSDLLRFISPSAAGFQFTNQGQSSTWLTLTGSTMTSAVPLVTPASTTSAAGVNIPPGTAPTSPTNGDVWTTTSAMFARINGATVDITTTPVLIGVACSDETTAITTGTAKVTFRAPYAFTLTAVRATLTTASSSGTPTVDINEAGTSVLSTKLTIDANEKTSTTAATAAVISDSTIADDAEITIDIDTAGTGAAGLKVWLIGTR